MKYIKIICTVLLAASVMFLTSCKETEYKNIDIFFKELNGKNICSFSEENMLITKEAEGICYTALLDNNTLISFYTEETGIVKHIVFTTDKRFDSAHEKLMVHTGSVLTDMPEETIKKLLLSAKETKSSAKDDFNIFLSESDIGSNLVMTLKINELNKNNRPRLKKHINDEDISRPVLQKDTENN